MPNASAPKHNSCCCSSSSSACRVHSSAMWYRAWSSQLLGPQSLAHSQYHSWARYIKLYHASTRNAYGCHDRLLPPQYPSVYAVNIGLAVTKRAVRRSVRVSAHDRRARKSEALLGPNHMHDPCAKWHSTTHVCAIPHNVRRYYEKRRTLLERFARKHFRASACSAPDCPKLRVQLSVASRPPWRFKPDGTAKYRHERASRAIMCMIETRAFPPAPAMMWTGRGEARRGMWATVVAALTLIVHAEIRQAECLHVLLESHHLKSNHAIQPSKNATKTCRQTTRNRMGRTNLT